MENIKKSSYNLEYELTQLKIDNYGKSIIQVRGMSLAISGLLLTFFYQQNIIESLFILIIIIIILLQIENEHFSQQSKLYKHIIKLEKESNKIENFRFTLGKNLSNKTSPKERFKLLKKSWLLLSLIVVTFINIVIFYKNDLERMENKILQLNHKYEKSLIDFYKINDELINLSKEINYIENNENSLKISIERLEINKENILDNILNLKSQKEELIHQNKNTLNEILVLNEEVNKLSNEKKHILNELIKLKLIKTLVEDTNKKGKTNE